MYWLPAFRDSAPLRSDSLYEPSWVKSILQRLDSRYRFRKYIGCRIQFSDSIGQCSDRTVQHLAFRCSAPVLCQLPYRFHPPAASPSSFCAASSSASTFGCSSVIVCCSFPAAAENVWAFVRIVLVQSLIPVRSIWEISTGGSVCRSVRFSNPSVESAAACNATMLSPIVAYSLEAGSYFICSCCNAAIEACIAASLSVPASLAVWICPLSAAMI